MRASVRDKSIAVAGNASPESTLGDEITSASNDPEKFATYTRDSYTGLDYANQRYYASTYGRFNTPDPYMRSAGRNDPEAGTDTPTSQVIR